MNVAKAKVMHSVRDGIIGEMNIVMDGLVLEETADFKSLGSLDLAGRRVDLEIQ